MDVKSINTTNWRNHKRKTRIIEEEREPEAENDLLDRYCLSENSTQINHSHSPNTLEWLSTWRKIVG